MDKTESKTAHKPMTKAEAQEKANEAQMEGVTRLVKAFETTLCNLLGKPIHMVVAFRPVGVKRRSPDVLSYAPGSIVYELLLDATKDMIDDMESSTSVIEDASGNRIVKDPTLKIV